MVLTIVYSPRKLTETSILLVIEYSKDAEKTVDALDSTLMNRIQFQSWLYVNIPVSYEL